MRPSISWIFLYLWTFCFTFSLAQQDAKCSFTQPCYVGCCSSSGNCGFGDEYCGRGCQGTCDAKAECGQYAPSNSTDCPINVCCSKFGFCGVTEGFCGDGCQKNSKGGGCGQPNRPSCPSNTNPLTYSKRIAYYELFTQGRSCNVKEPEDLPVGPLTHINLAFVNFGSDFKLIDDHSDWVKRMVLRKLRYPKLKINISVGGWAFNDGATASYFSNMASTASNRRTFINSVVSYLRRYNLDGIDIDWEYPVAVDRGGKKEDAANYVSLLSELREAFDRENTDWEISIAIPSSYWYLRGFDLPGLQKSVNHFNLMSYDIYGMWDKENKFTGPYLKGHTDWTQIQVGLDLLWRNGVDPKKVVMGFAFYGRSFTMADPSCTTPNGVCKFSDGGVPGDCSDTAGILTYQEISSRNSTLDVTTLYNQSATVKYNVFGGSQWVSYDDAQSFRDKLDRLSTSCLSGLMIWAIDQDTGGWDSMKNLFGDYSGLELEGLQSGDAEKLSDLFGQFNGQQCYVTETCTDGTSGQQNSGQVCANGFQSVEIAHNPPQHGGFKRNGDCSEGRYRHICCPKTSMPQNCAWNGGQRSPVNQAGRTCGSTCGDGKFELSNDNYLSAKGGGICTRGNRKLCCDSTLLFDQCKWMPCQGPLAWANGENPKCPSGWDFQTWRYNRPSGDGLCREEYVSPVDGSIGSPIKEPFRSAFCCPKGKTFSKCNWSNNPQPRKSSDVVMFDLNKLCLPNNCEKWQVKVTDATDPPEGAALSAANKAGCDGYSVAPGFDPRFPYCCEPPSTFSKDWPVNPDYLWKVAFSNPDTDSAVWDYNNEHEYNDKDTSRAPDGAIDGSDAYGFMMLNGPEEALDDKFSTTNTVVRRSSELPKVKRSIITSNHTLIDKTFDHPEEIFHVYCNYPAQDTRCNRVFKGGVEDTIIKLPDHVGVGPFARIISMVVAEDFSLPSHHLEHRSLDGLHDNPVYEVKIDYNFHLARQDRGTVNMRVDFTNLLGYWDGITNTPASRAKRSYDYDGFTLSRFRERVNAAEEVTQKLGKRSTTLKAKLPLDFFPDGVDGSAVGSNTKLEKRWFGSFLNWLQRLTTISGSEVGDFPLDYHGDMNLYRASAGCPGKAAYASLTIDLEADLLLQATYAYYYSATLIPFPQKPDMYFYFGIEPEARLAIHLKGYAQMRAPTQRRKLIDTIGFPGLSIPGIAAVGPTLDLFGELRAILSLSGDAKAGAKFSMGRTQAYWPQGDDAVKQFDKLGVDLKKKPEIPEEKGLIPIFDAGVGVSAEIDVIIQPEANLGIQIGGGKLTAGKTAVQATVSAFLETILQFRASGNLNIPKQTFDYAYGAYIRYNLGFEAKVEVLAGWINWALAPRFSYNPARTIKIYEQKGTIDMKAGSKRSVNSFEGQWVRLTNKPELFANETLGLRDWKHGPNDWVNAKILDDPSSRNGTDPIWNNFFSKRQTGSTDPGGDTDPHQPKIPPSGITCPPQANGRTWEIPELRFNCAAMPSRSLKGTPFETSCDGFRLLTLPQTWTHDPDVKRVERRRRDACGLTAATCGVKQSLAQYAGGSNNVKDYPFECDETPMASTEEGGTFLTTRAAVCIPAIDNNNAGQCNRLLSDVLESNVGKMHWAGGKALADRVNSWQPWTNSPSFWSTAGASAGSATQNLVVYPNIQPDPAGGPTRINGSYGWMHKRNYTFSVINDGDLASEWWGATGKTFKSPSNIFQYPNGFNSILCAVNFFNQTDFYRLNANNYNGYCRRNAHYTSEGWPVYRMSRCKIDFGTTTKKRGIDGVDTFGGWEVRGVEMIGNPEDDILVTMDRPTPLAEHEDGVNIASNPREDAATSTVRTVDTSDYQQTGAKINRTYGTPGTGDNEEDFGEVEGQDLKAKAHLEEIS